MSLPELELAPGRPVSIDRLVRAQDGRPTRFATRVELVDLGEVLSVAFDCDDPEPWATHRERDAPLWEEEVVELFLAPGAENPKRYFEFEVNPLGALFDAVVDSPHGDRRDLLVDREWNCEDIAWRADARSDATGWSARLDIPWCSLHVGESPTVWRANLFRIDRPRNDDAEFSAWSATGIEPADFHRPKSFGILRRLG